MKSLLATAVFCAGFTVCAATAAPDPDALLKKAFDNYRANSSTGTIVTTIFISSSAATSKKSICSCY